MAAATYGPNGGTAASHVWTVWASTCTAATTPSTAEMGTWGTWCTNGTTANTCTIWTNWNSATAPSTFSRNHIVHNQQITAEQAERYRQQAEEANRRAEEERKKRIAAEKRATRLLKKLLSTEQLREFERKDHFHVVAKSGKRYRIRKSNHINVDELNETGKVSRRLCAYVPGVPLSDHLLSQKLALEHDEAAFLRAANVHAA